jgi:multidrug efflux pump subunit AcrA (membrane-fusion protein)
MGETSDVGMSVIENNGKSANGFQWGHSMPAPWSRSGKVRIVLLASTVAAILVASAAFAQDSTKRPVPQGLRGFPTSTNSIPIPSAQPIISDRPFADGAWLSFDKCPVFAVETLDLPSQEAGVIASIDIEENASVDANQVIGKLEGKVAELEKGVAGLQAQVAASEAIDESEIRLAEAFVEEAQLQVEIFEETTAKGSTGAAELRQKQLALTQAKVRLTQTKSMKQQKELKSRLAQASLFLSQQKTDRLSFRSPISGTVTRIDHRPGEWVQAGATVFKIIRLNELRVDCFIDMEQVDPSKLIDLPVKIVSKRGSIESLFAGKITSYDPDVSSSGKLRLHAVVQNQKMGNHWSLLPGMSVRMQMLKPQ